MIEERVDLNEKTNNGQLRHNYNELVEYFIEMGVSKNEKRNERTNVLHIAAQEKHIELVKYLIENGVNLNEKTFVTYCYSVRLQRAG